MWVHGGGFTQGGSSEFNGTALALHQNCVVVTLNYRLGPLGFLALKGLEDGRAANAGLMDQQSALRWVKREASSFGGDPARVLLFGQSAGGGSVLTHMLMPGSKGPEGKLCHGTPFLPRICSRALIDCALSPF